MNEILFSYEFNTHRNKLYIFLLQKLECVLLSDPRLARELLVDERKFVSSFKNKK